MREIFFATLLSLALHLAAHAAGVTAYPTAVPGDLVVTGTNDDDDVRIYADTSHSGYFVVEFTTGGTTTYWYSHAHSCQAGAVLSIVIDVKAGSDTVDLFGCSSALFSNYYNPANTHFADVEMGDGIDEWFGGCPDLHNWVHHNRGQGYGTYYGGNHGDHIAAYGYYAGAGPLLGSYVETGSGADQIETDDGPDVVRSGGGNDNIQTFGAWDAIYPGPGVDEVTGGYEEDHIHCADDNEADIVHDSGDFGEDSTPDIDFIFLDAADVAGGNIAYDETDIIYEIF